MFFNRKKKISIIGAGNAGCISALHYGYYGRDNFDVTLYYDSEVPIAAKLRKVNDIVD